MSRPALVSTVAACLLASACTRPGPTPQELEAIVAPARQAAEAKEKVRRAGLAAAIGQLVPRPDLGACPFEPRLPTAEKNKSFDLERMAREIDMVARIGFDRFVKAPDLAEAPGPLYSTARRLIDGTTTIEAAHYAADEAAKLKWDYDVVLVERASEKAVRDGDKGFTGGTWSGWALLWDYEQGKLLCMSDVSVQLSEVQYTTLYTKSLLGGRQKVGDGFEGAAAVKLMREATTAALEHLVLAGPPP